MWTELHPSETEAVPPLPTFDVAVDEDYCRPLDVYHYDGIGTIWLEEWRLTNGTRHQVMFGEPLHRRTDIVTVMDTTWGTQLRGWNQDWARLFMRLGLPTLVKGPQLGSAVSLAQNANHSHAILDVTQRRGDYQDDTIMVRGFSLGAMIGFGTIAYASQYKRQVLYADLTDPGRARPFGPLAQEFKAWLPDYPLEVATSLHELGQLLLQPRRLQHYLNTFDISVDGLRQFIETGREVFSGDAGLLARHFPADNHATLALADNSWVNQGYEEIFAPHPGVNIVRYRHLGHVAAALAPRVAQDTIRRLEAVAKQLHPGETPQLDYDALQLAA